MEDAIQLAPDDASARAGVVRAYLANRGFSRREPRRKISRGIWPLSCDGYYLASLVAHEQGRLEEFAGKNLEQLLALQPNSIELLTSLTRFNLDRGVAARGHRASAEHRGSRPEERTGFRPVGRGVSPDERIRPTATLVLNEVSRSRAPLMLSYWGLRRCGWPRTTRRRGAQYRKGLEVAPAQPASHLRELAGLYEKRGRIDAAIDQYDTLYRTDPTARSGCRDNLACCSSPYKTDRAEPSTARGVPADLATSSSAVFLDTRGVGSIQTT